MTCAAKQTENPPQTPPTTPPAVTPPAVTPPATTPPATTPPFTPPVVTPKPKPKPKPVKAAAICTQIRVTQKTIPVGKKAKVTIKVTTAGKPVAGATVRLVWDRCQQAREDGQERRRRCLAQVQQGGDRHRHARRQEVMLVGATRRRRNVRTPGHGLAPDRQAACPRAGPVGPALARLPARRATSSGGRAILARMLLEPGYAEGTRVVHLTHTTLVVEALCGEQAELHGEPDWPSSATSASSTPAAGCRGRDPGH